MLLSDIVNGKSNPACSESSVPLIYFAYARVSTDDQDRMGLSIPAQIKEMYAFALSKGIEIAEVFQEAESAFSDESRRPKFNEMVNRAITDSRISGILVHESSRFFRDPHAGPMVKGQLLAHGVRVVSATEPEYDPETTSGLAIEKMTEFKNAAYSMDIAFHTRKGMKENIARRDQEIGFCYKNGGAALWGFSAYKVQRGVNGRGTPIMKTLWGKNMLVVAGRPTWEWCYQVLTDLRLRQRKSLDGIRDFLNEHDIPSARKKYWGTSSIHALLQESALLQFAGFGVWNVHKKGGDRRPPSEWVIVPKAHPAIITLEEADLIMAVNNNHSKTSRSRSTSRMSEVRSKSSRYILSGGLFVCIRCGANMVGHTNRGRHYYRCGTSAYRKGLGCGAALYVPKEEMENAVFEEISHLFNSMADPKRIKNLMNKELKALTAKESIDSANVTDELKRVEAEIENIRSAIKNGLDDISWANNEIQHLNTERHELLAQQAKLSMKKEQIRIDTSMVKKLMSKCDEVLSHGSLKDKKDFTRIFMKRIDLNPDTGDVLMHLYSGLPQINSGKRKNPASLETGSSFGMVAGTGFEPAAFGL